MTHPQRYLRLLGVPDIVLRLREWRRASGVRQREAAELFGICYRNYSKLETGAYRCSAGMRVRIEAFLAANDNGGGAVCAPAAWDVTKRPIGSHYGGKYGSSVACPVCSRAALIFRRGRTEGVFWTDYAHRFSLDLDHKHEPRMTASEICRKLGDPSAKVRKGGK
jgi:DNA-binding XRE family transcriptional regulator